MIDIVDRLKFDAVRCEAQFSKGVAGNIDEAASEIARLRQGIQDYLDGNYENARKHRHEDPQYRCEHGQHYWEDCGQCIDAHFHALLDDAAVPHS